ncbi:hypothetical protein BV898_05728 [Hypsibius exemplaris]|uniref:Uncharacterized protein n=1 Tax=Hypsibius exemplaris TaxID=2072580 RepID=A0A1W0WY87_HYPEX|nr:hypothetical protein BV898_05728 [Hypsibius exemplaris]
MDSCLSHVSRLICVVLLVGMLSASSWVDAGSLRQMPQQRRGGAQAAASPTLQMLMRDPGYESSSSGSGGETINPKYDDLAALVDSLSKVRALGDYFSHRGRPRYG